MEIYAYPELQSQLQMKVAQIESKLAQIDAFSITALITLKADTTLFTPKGKGTKRVSYVEKKRTVSISKTSSSSISRKAPKKQPVILASKTISTVMTGYNPELKENVHEFTAVLIGVFAFTTIATLYSNNPAHLILTPTGCKAFKLIQNRGTRKLIIYYETWANLDKVIVKKELASEGEGR
ncbi:hypothetical protein RhiirA5_426688 [Rhizophagus irregularis]|uniref:Uncharacterized protein n=1 Tax=Rhizophagus irregularis TaxID=588596 RepID=A0A2N0P3P7_9GLOM|nr:hypothetical protein RhiirA5_426688 [Rhizophagus irregularis]